MKSAAIGLCLVLIINPAISQEDDAAGHMIEGGKIIVELIKAFKNKKELERMGNCKNSYGDICIMNETGSSLFVSLDQHHTDERRSMVIQSNMRECCLQIGMGVWTYDLRVSEASPPIRRGDILIEDCQRLLMNVKL